MSLIRELAISLPIFIVVALFATHLAVVPTGSMSPAINEGDVVFVQNTEALQVLKEFDVKDVKIGDIIIYKSNLSENEDSTIHRVVATNDTNGTKYFILKGDNNIGVDDENVYSEDITARVLTWGGNPIKIPQLGWVLLWFHL
jgi:signal peptidase I